MAEIETGAGAAGVLCALGDWNNGWAWYLLDGRPVFVFNVLGELSRCASSQTLTAGLHTLAVEYEWAKTTSRMKLASDGKLVEEGPIPTRLPLRWQIGGAGLLVGRDRGFPVCDDYRPPFAFNGVIKRLVLEVPALAPRDAVQETAAALHRE